MLVYVIRRLSQSLVVVAVMAALVFVGVYAIGNPIDMMISPDATQEEMQAAIERLGLDKPLWEQFFVFVGNMLQGDMGTSFVHNEPALDLILQRLPATMELALFAMLIAAFVGVPLGIIAGLRAEGPTGRTIMAGSIFGFSLPNFWQGLGKLLIDSIVNLDRPVVVAYLMLTVLVFILINFLVDLAYSALDPRVRLTESKG